MKKKKTNKKQGLKEIIKSNKKLIVGIVVGLLISSGTVYAATILYASDETSYDDTKTSYTLEASDVQTALDKLYQKEEECNTVQITYNKGDCLIASSLPSSQSVRRNSSISLASGTPTCSDGKVFLGWAVTPIAIESSKWYDPSDTVTVNSNLKLYAQWYDVDALENWYTTVVQDGDFRREDVSTTTTTEANKAYSNVSMPFPTISGYTYEYVVAGFEAVGYRRIYGMSPISGVMHYRSLAAATSKQNTMQYLYTKDRTASTSPSTAIDTRIDNLQKIQEKAISYDEIKTTAYTKDNISVSGSANTTFAPASGYKLLSWAGYSYSNATTNGVNSSRTAVFRNKITDTSATVSIMSTVSSLSNTPKIKITAYFIEVKDKSDVTHTTFSPNAYSTKGASRYYALKVLDNNKTDYFPASYIKTTRFAGPDYTIDNWGSGDFSTTATIPSGKMLGVTDWVVGYHNGSGSSYTTPMIIHLGYSNTTSATIRNYIRCQNTQRSSTAGATCTKVYPQVRIVYISPTYAEGEDIDDNH